MFEINKNHPELREGEMLLANVDKHCYDQMRWKTKRIGEVALSNNGEIIKDIFPVFVMKSEIMPNKIVNKKRYDNCIKMIGRIDAIRSLIEGLEGIDVDDMTEEEYDENVHQASNLLFHAGRILESSSKKYVEES